MATLSANSRRNSATLSVSNSPRPSLTGTNGSTPVQAIPLLTSLNEEKHVSDQVDNHKLETTKESASGERSDSGLSDCSNASHKTQPTIQPEEKIVDTGKENSKPVEKISVSQLKEKLEKMAQDHNNHHQPPSIIPKTDLKIIKLKNILETNGNEQKNDRIHDIIPLKETTITEMKISRPSIIPSDPLQQKIVVEKEQIMKSDFTNTVKMRKKSLELNLSRNKMSQPHSPRMLFETSGKVSKLLQHFDFEPNFNERKTSIDLIEKNPQENAFVECTLAPLPKEAVTQQSIAIKTTMNKPSPVIQNIPSSIVSNQKNIQNANRSISRRNNASPTNRNVFARLSPTRNSNPKTSNTTSIENNSIVNKFTKINLVETTGATTTKDSITTTIAGRKSAITTTIANKTTAYATFNRTTPIRLSGRVKEVTERLSTPKSPKAIKKSIDDGHNRTISSPHASHFKSMTCTATTTTTASTIFTARSVYNAKLVDKFKENQQKR